MSSSSSSQYVCVGTKRISIINDDEEDSGGDGDAIISLYRQRPAKISRSSSTSRSSPTSDYWRSPSPRESFDSNCTVDDSLHLMATDGEYTYYKSIVAKDIKHMTQTSSIEQLLDQVESILLQKNKTLDEEQIFKVAYKKMGGQVFGSGTTQDTLTTTCVKVSIRKTLANSIVRPIWEGNLIPISHSNYDTLPIFAQHALPANNDVSNQYETTASSLAFSIILGDTVTKLQKDIIALREENEQLRVNTNRWKGTAQRLNNQWQSEKSELTERFLTLFNQHKARHVETKKELDEVKGNQRYDRSSLGNSSEIHREERSEMRVDDEDEHDYETWDDDYVNRMAAGGSTQQKRRRKKPNAAAIRDVLRSDDEQDDDDDQMEVAPL